MRAVDFFGCQLQLQFKFKSVICMRHSFAGKKVTGATDNLYSSSKTSVETFKLGFSLNKRTFYPISRETSVRNCK